MRREVAEASQVLRPMMRLPGLPNPSFHLALPLMLLAVVSCGGRVDTSGGAGGGPGQGSSPDAGSGGSGPSGGAGGGPVFGLTCSDPIHVSIGGTINGSTCAGTYRPDPGSPCDYNSPSVYFYVEAPSGTAFSINSPSLDSTMSLIVSGYYDACTDAVSPNCGGTPFAPTVTNLRLFTVQFGPPTQMNANPDAGVCGDFTITIVGE